MEDNLFYLHVSLNEDMYVPATILHKVHECCEDIGLEIDYLDYYHIHGTIQLTERTPERNQFQYFYLVDVAKEKLEPFKEYFKSCETCLIVHKAPIDF